MQPVPEPLCMQVPAYAEFRFRVSRSNRRHHPRTGPCIDDVHHQLLVFLGILNIGEIIE